MHLELVSIPTPTSLLDGLFYEPEGGATVGGVLLFHGNTVSTGSMSRDPIFRARSDITAVDHGAR